MKSVWKIAQTSHSPSSLAFANTVLWQVSYSNIPAECAHLHTAKASYKLRENRDFTYAQEHIEATPGYGTKGPYSSGCSQSEVEEVPFSPDASISRHAEEGNLIIYILCTILAWHLVISWLEVDIGACDKNICHMHMC